MDFMPSHTTPPTEQQSSDGVSAKDRAAGITSDILEREQGQNTPSRKPVNTTEASKRGAEVNERLRKAVSERDDEAARKAIADQDAIEKWAQSRRDRAEGKDTQTPVLSAKDRAAGISVEMIERERAQKHQTAEQSRDSWEDEPWNQKGAVQKPAPDVDPMKPYRRRDAYTFEMPVDGPPLDEAVVADWGSVAVHTGLSYEAAHNIFGEITGALGGSSSKEREALVAGGGSYDQQRTVTELRFEWGADLEPTLAKIEKLCAKHPSLSAYLDSTGLGDSPAVLRMLAGAATIGTTREAAQAFINKVNGDAKHPYWRGAKLALAQMKWAYAIVGSNGPAAR